MPTALRGEVNEFYTNMMAFPAHAPDQTYTSPLGATQLWQHNKLYVMITHKKWGELKDKTDG